MIIRINGQSPVQLIKVLFWEMCSLGSRNCGQFADWATSICSKTYKKTILPRNSALKRCSREETPQHRVLENTLNMGSILHGLEWFYSRWDVKACKRDTSQTREVRMITWWMWREHVSFAHLWYHVTTGRLKDILELLLEQNKTITTCNIWIKDDHYKFAAMRKPCTAIPAYASKMMRSATSTWKQDIKKPLGSFCDLMQQNTLITYEKHVIILLKSFNML